MTTTSIHPGHGVSSILNNCEWGEGYTDTERRTLDRALIAKFEEMARAATGDDSITYYPHTSEIQYECWGQTTREHHCLDPKHHWAQEDIDFSEIAQEAGEWIAEHIQDIIEDAE